MSVDDIKGQGVRAETLEPRALGSTTGVRGKLSEPEGKPVVVQKP